MIPWLQFTEEGQRFDEHVVLSVVYASLHFGERRVSMTLVPRKKSKRRSDGLSHELGTIRVGRLSHNKKATRQLKSKIIRYTNKYKYMRYNNRAIRFEAAYRIT